MSRATSEAAAGAAAWRDRSATPWFWQFRLLEAEAHSALSNRRQAEALLKDPVPSEPRLAQLEVRRLLDLAVLGTCSREETSAMLARARAAVRDPELAVRLEVAEGLVAGRQARMKDADACYRKAVEAARRLGNLYWQCQGLVNLSYTTKNLQRHEESVELGLSALSLAGKIGARRLAAAAHGNLGSSYAYLGDFEPALEHQRKAIEAFESIGARSNLMIAVGELALLHDRRGDYDAAIAAYRRAYNLALELKAERDAARQAENLATTLVKTGRWDQAAEWNQRAIELADKLRANAMRPYLLRNSAWIAYGRGRPQEAARICRDALNEKGGIAGTRWPLYGLLGLIDSNAGRYARAVRSFEQGLQLIEESRSDLLQPQNRITLLSRLIPFYRDYVDVLVKQNDDARALRVVESSRARVLSERLGRDLGPQEFPGLARCQEFARSNRAALLSFWLAPNRSYAWLVTARGVRRFVLPPEAEIARLVTAWRGVVEHALRDPIVAADASGPALWKAVMGEIAGAVPKDARLIVIPDGVLHRVNLETLVASAPQPHYWIENVEMAVCPSLTIGISPARAAGARADGPVLLIGAPDYAGTAYPPLKNAAAELRGIQSLFNGRARSLYTGAQASPAAYRQARPEQFAFIHFAAHAEANPERPMESAVILAHDKERYKLFARDVIDLPIQARLVTLSACRSAGARAYAGEGLVGFAWAFLQAGARAVTAGLWDVSDNSTEQLMSRFYAGLASGADPVSALRNAKLGLLKDTSAFRKPYYWGPFQVYLASAAR